MTGGTTADSLDPKQATLTGSERLVRDGVAKLFLCWTVWTLAQHRQTNAEIRGLTKLRNKVCENALQIILQTCKGRGVGAGPKMAKDGIRPILKKDKLVEFAEGKDVTSLDALVKDLVPTVTRGKSLSAVASEDWLVLPTWRDVQAFPKTQAQLKSIAENGTLADHGGAHEGAARMFWGSGGSLERTTHLDLEARHDLTTYLRQPDAQGNPASPIPVRLVEHWAKILGFHETFHKTDHPDAKAVRTAFGDPSDSPAGLVGGSLKDFAEHLDNWLSVSRKIEVPNGGWALVSGSEREATLKAANDPPDQRPPAVFQPPVGARQVVRVDQKPTDPDEIRLTVDCSGNHLVVKNVDFVIDSAEPDATYRLCLRSLDVVLTWPLTDDPVVSDSHASWTGGPDDDVKVVRIRSDGRVQAFTVCRKDGKLLPPRQAIAFRRFTLPAYALAKDLQFKAALHAYGSETKIGKRLADDQYISLESLEQDVTEAEAGMRLLVELKETIKADFPRQSTVPKELGHRIVTIARNDR